MEIFGIEYLFFLYLNKKRNDKMKQTWSDLSVKEKIAIISAIAAFVIGWCMSIGAFFVPPMGEVADSILWILGQALLYAASVFGVSAYFRSETVQLRKDMDRHLEHMERMQIQREKLRQGIDIQEIPKEDDLE
jgi:peptidoglycan biosynthesis protein MviN/MurJ (putative lipid II flippase)